MPLVVRLHDLGLQVGARPKFAIGQIHAGLRSRWLRLRLLVLRESRHLLSFAHFEHLVLWRTHLHNRPEDVSSINFSYIEDLLFLRSRLLRCSLCLELLNLSRHVVDLLSNIFDNLVL